MTEAEMQKAKVPTFDTIEQLTEYINNLVNQQHDYGTCVYAMSMASVATFNFIAHKLGVTGFQASCADLDFIARVRGMKLGFMILNAEDLMYPQYDLQDRVHKWINNKLDSQEFHDAVIKRLEGDLKHVAPEVVEHWRKIAKYAPNSD